MKRRNHMWCRGKCARCGAEKPTSRRAPRSACVERYRVNHGARVPGDGPRAALCDPSIVANAGTSLVDVVTCKSCRRIAEQIEAAKSRPLPTVHASTDGAGAVCHDYKGPVRTTHDPGCVDCRACRRKLERFPQLWNRLATQAAEQRAAGGAL